MRDRSRAVVWIAAREIVVGSALIAYARDSVQRTARMPRRHTLQPQKSFSRPQETPKVSSVMLTEQRDASHVS
jgi:hypothetical protein